MIQAIRQLQLQLVPLQQEHIQVQQHLPHITMGMVELHSLLLLLPRLHMTFPRLTMHHRYLLQPILVQTLITTTR